jgi:hypothetical protein
MVGNRRSRNRKMMRNEEEYKSEMAENSGTGHCQILSTAAGLQPKLLEEA